VNTVEEIWTMPGERFNVQFTEGGEQPYDIILEVGMEGVHVMSPHGSRVLLKIPLETISRWSLRGSRLLLFTKHSVCTMI
jgi:hypothetical protein